MGAEPPIEYLIYVLAKEWGKSYSEVRRETSVADFQMWLAIKRGESKAYEAERSGGAG